MGYGTYTAEFGKVGKIFTVDPDYPDEAAFDAYSKGYESDYGTAYKGDIDEYRQEVYTADWERLQYLINDALGQDMGFREAGGRKRATFDSDFILVASSDLVEVGIHDYHGTYVVGVAPAGRFSEWALEPKAYASEIASEFAMTPADFEQRIAALADKVGDLLRSKAQASGFTPMFRTGSYTSAEFEKKDDAGLASEQETLEGEIAGLRSELSRGVTIEAVFGDGDLRRNLVLIAEKDGDYGDRSYQVVTVLYDVERSFVLAFDVNSGQKAYGVLPAPSRALLDALAAAYPDGDGLASLPEAEEEVYLREMAERQVGKTCDWVIPLRHAEVEGLVGRPLTVTYDDMEYEFGAEDAPAAKPERSVSAPAP